MLAAVAPVMNTDVASCPIITEVCCLNLCECEWHVHVCKILQNPHNDYIAYIVLVYALSVMCGTQAYVSRARVDSFSLIADMMYVSSNAPRIARSVFEICLRRGWSSCADLALTLCKVTTKL